METIMTKKQKVFVTRELPGQGLEKVKKLFRTKMNPYDRVLTKKELLRGVKNVDGLLCLLTDTIDKKVMEQAPNLKIIANYAVGFNNVDVKEATKRGIMVTNTPGVLNDTTADLAWVLLMATARRIAEADKFTKRKLYKGWAPELLLGHDVWGKTLGIVGMGRIGKEVARRAAGFKMKVIYTDVRRFPEVEKDLKKQIEIKYVPLKVLLKTADFVTIHVPLLPGTRHLIGKKEFKMMKQSAILINAARGPIVDEKALVSALKKGWIAGAGLDVFEKEPKVEPGLLKLNNAVLLPHLGSASIETRIKMTDMAVENLIYGLAGRIPPNIVNKEVL
jgi:glyoxylate reductase